MDVWVRVVFIRHSILHRFLRPRRLQLKQHNTTHRLQQQRRQHRVHNLQPTSKLPSFPGPNTTNLLCRQTQHSPYLQHNRTSRRRPRKRIREPQLFQVNRKGKHNRLKRLSKRKRSTRLRHRIPQPSTQRQQRRTIRTSKASLRPTRLIPILRDRTSQQDTRTRLTNHNT